VQIRRSIPSTSPTADGAADQRSPLRRRQHGRAAVLALAALGIACLPAPSGSTTPGPTPQIIWGPCAPHVPSGFDCGTMDVPLDYGRPRSGETIRLAMVRLPASDPDRRIGTIFWDPGGPGGSGTKFMPAIAHLIFSEKLRARFDIVGLDPRGVGLSTSVHCFDTPEEEAEFFAGSPRRLGDGFPVGSAQMATWIERYRRFGEVCKRRNGKLLRYLSTVDSANDLDLLRQAVGDEGLNYIGTSYGTVLGATYANLFPDRVRALVLDGDVNPIAWTKRGPRGAGGLRLSTGMRNTADEGAERALNAFLDLCGEAGPARCAFAAGSPEATRARFAELLQLAPTNHTAGRKTYAQILAQTMIGLYSLRGWGPTASALQSEWIKATTGATGPADEEPEPETEEQELAVACAESPSPPASTYPRMDAFAFERSGVAGPYWAWDYQPCSTWPVRAAHRYKGPWNRRTANPVLVVGTTFDHATPYASAVAMSELLGDARLLTLDGYGHTALLNPSACVMAYQDDYYIHGTLPPPGTRCSQDHAPFEE
jgi:pimeloyl-ACP methyl ester carboxylesterase